VIGDNIILEVLTIRGGKVSIGLAAPKEIKIWRSEVAPQKDAAPKIEDGTEAHPAPEHLSPDQSC
jgi:sRNA-binding carbon storage regulator CsrA